MRNPRILPTIVSAIILTAAANAASALEVEHDVTAYKGGRGLGTMGYPATDKEKKLKLDEDAKDKDGSQVVQGNNGKTVAWFGIVRKVAADSLVVEQKYFDNLSDLHQQIVSLHGSGDFHVKLAEPLKDVQAGMLVRIAGKVEEKDKKVTLTPQYVRYWKQGEFAFMAYGEEKSNPEWIKLRKSLGKFEEYDSKPNAAYYKKTIGE